MEQLKVRFSKSDKERIDDLVQSVGFNKSVIARAALRYGLDVLEESDKQKSINLIGLSQVKDRLGK